MELGSKIGDRKQNQRTRKVQKPGRESRIVSTLSTKEEGQILKESCFPTVRQLWVGVRQPSQKATAVTKHKTGDFLGRDRTVSPISHKQAL